MYQYFLGNPAKDILRKGLLDLTAVCEHILATFEVRALCLVSVLRKGIKINDDTWREVQCDH